VREVTGAVIRYDCTENDNHFYVSTVDEEILVGDCLEKGWLVIGIRELCEGLRRAGYVVTITSA
jgi:hypothetical protein